MSYFVSRKRAVLFSGLLVLAGAVSVALMSVRSYAGGWNDGSRLATVECLVDYHTLAIDRSIFVRPPEVDLAQSAAGKRHVQPSWSPYPLTEPHLLRDGTCDKLWIRGHYYSDKSPVPAVLLAGWYKALQAATGLTARDRPDRFCYWMGIGSSGLAYVVAVLCIYGLGRPLRLSLPVRLMLTAGFALTTVALPYVRHVNNHILLLAVAAALMMGLAVLTEASHNSGFTPAARQRGRVSWGLVSLLGALAGLGYTIDLAAGPLLAAGTGALVVYRCGQQGTHAPRLHAACVFLLGAAPWLVLHHTVNYAVGGTFKPANAVPEYFQWPGCPFDSQNMTGMWNHSGIGHFLTYAAALLAGKRGFLGHNLALWMALPAVVALLRVRIGAWPELLFCISWCGATWLAYAVASTNYSGLCCSVRWFVPLLAPGYYVLALFLCRHPAYIPDFLVLSGWGAVIAALMWRQGTWMPHMVPFFWPLQASALISWLAWTAWRWRRQKKPIYQVKIRTAPARALLAPRAKTAGSRRVI
jgi:hypothetical protein